MYFKISKGFFLIKNIKIIIRIEFEKFLLLISDYFTKNN